MQNSSRIVWSAEKGWHDGETVELTVDAQGRIVAEQVAR